MSKFVSLIFIFALVAAIFAIPAEESENLEFIGERVVRAAEAYPKAQWDYGGYGRGWSGHYGGYGGPYAKGYEKGYGQSGYGREYGGYYGGQKGQSGYGK